ncbi:MAG: hypothetical protein IIX03_03105 [Paludibacteraceae bacterium]|nr:hypothetical protein [Paludibacteraceae bacterium]
MRKVRFNQRYGEHDAVVTGNKTQFHLVENNLVDYFESHYPQAKVVDVEPLTTGDGMFRVMLDLGVSFDYKPKYQIGEVLEVIGTRGKVKIRITGIKIERLCNTTRQETLNEGFFVKEIDNYRQYCYMDSEESELMHFRAHFECWISFLYRTLDADLVLNNPYSVVYEFELIKNV